MWGNCILQERNQVAIVTFERSIIATMNSALAYSTVWNGNYFKDFTNHAYHLLMYGMLMTELKGRFVSLKMGGRVREMFRRASGRGQYLTKMNKIMTILKAFHFPILYSCRLSAVCHKMSYQSI